jgi:hypothetical protein
MKELIKKRVVPLNNMSRDHSMGNLIDSLNQCSGIKSVSIDNKNRLHITYDLLKVNLNAIQSSVESAGYSFAVSLWQRFKRGWMSFTEENEYNNMTGSHSCCSVGDGEKIASRHP